MANYELGMKKGTSWKRVFIHEDGKLIDQARLAIENAGIPTYSNDHTVTHGVRPRYETWIFAPRDRRADAEQALANAGIIEL